MRKNADQNNSEYKHFLRSVMHADLHKKNIYKKDLYRVFVMSKYEKCSCFV